MAVGNGGIQKQAKPLEAVKYRYCSFRAFGHVQASSGVSGLGGRLLEGATELAEARHLLFPCFCGNVFAVSRFMMFSNPQSPFTGPLRMVALMGVIAYFLMK